MSVLDDMKVFIQVVESNSFSAAGRKLRMSAALVSSRIARLESHLAIRLLNRTTRKVSVTDAGQVYYEDSIDILRRVEEAENRLSDQTGVARGVLRVTASNFFGQYYISHLIPGFIKQNPHIRVQFQVTDRLVDLLAEGIDLAVRASVMQDSNFKTRVLAPSERFIVASPLYLEKHGIPQTPHELVDHNCLLLRFPGSRQFRWRFKEGEEVYELDISGTLDSDNSNVIKDWAIAGCGLTLKSIWEVEQEIREGRLVTVLTDYMPQDEFLHVVYPYERHVPPKVRLFIDYLVARMKQERQRPILQ